MALVVTEVVVEVAMDQHSGGDDGGDYYVAVMELVVTMVMIVWR